MLQHLLGDSVQVTIETASGPQSYDTRPPTVREALTVLFTTEGTATGDPDDTALFLATVEGWLPPALYAQLFEYSGRSTPLELSWKRWQWIRLVAPAQADEIRQIDRLAGVQTVSALVTALIDPDELPGAEHAAEDVDEDTPKDDSSEQQSETQSVHEIDWPTMVAEYSRCYGQAPEDVLEVPFPRFLLMTSRVGTLEARDSLSLLTVRALPYIESEDEREEILDSLRTRGRIPGHTPEEKAATAALKAEREEKADALIQAATLAGAFKRS
jgi:hypothetical protein